MTDKYKEYIEECQNEMNIKLNNDPERIKLRHTLSNISNLYDNIVSKKCLLEYDNMKLFSKIENQNGNVIQIPVDGKEKEALEAINEFRKCIGDIEKYPMYMKNLIDFSDNVISYQIDSCVNDCLNIDINNKSCIKDCYEKSFKYTISIFQQFIEVQALSIEDELKKL